MRLRHIALYSLTPLLYVLITIATGFVATGSEGGGLEYGWPLPWKTVELIPTCSGCRLPTTYNLIFFAIDCMFYTTIGYGVILFSRRIVWKKTDHHQSPDTER